MTPPTDDLLARLAALEAANGCLQQQVELAEGQRREAEELAAVRGRELAAAGEASRQRSRFFATLSHELRTPLAGVLGMAELLQATPLDGRQRGFVQAITGSADTLLAMVNDLLDFAKIEAGRLDLEHTPFDLWATVEAIAQDLQVRCGGKGLEFAFFLAPEVPRRVCGDALRLRQVLGNLGSNAVKFTDRGSVALEVELDAAGRLQAAFRDTGCGIPEEAAARLFTPFVQADASVARTHGGTGLGLAISRQLAQHMGGEVDFVSTPAVGSTFTLRLPLTPEPGWAAAPIGPPRRRRAVVAAPQAATRRMLTAHLARLGYDVAAASDARRAADLVVVECPDGKPAPETLPRRRASAHGTQLLLVLPPDHAVPAPTLAALGVHAVLVLPVRPTVLEAELAQRPAAAALPRVSCHASVLVAEDVALNRRVLEAQLANLGCQVTSVEDGEAAVAAAETGRFDLILMDCRMPGMDGREATARIRAWETKRGQHTPVVALTANALPGDREACLAAGMDDYLAKPFRQAELIAVLRRLRLVRE